MTLHRFRGQIAGLGTSSGTRVVIGCWDESPLGAFTDVMLAEPDGTRWLLAPTDEVADYVAATYRFDRRQVAPVTATRDETRWQITTSGLSIDLTVGRRQPLGHALRLLPRRLAEHRHWTALSDPFARLMTRGVRTRGTAGNDRREFYGATDLHAITSVYGTWREADLGALRPVVPDPGFGFSSTPPRPGVTTLVTTILTPRTLNRGSQ